MILSGLEIGSKIGREIIIDPFDRAKVNPNSYNLSLHNELITYTDLPLDMKKENPFTAITIPEEGLVLEPNRL
jgi:dCTP deaminase